MKKELDLAQIMRDSIMKANKDLGFLKEQEEQEKTGSTSAFDEEFDKERDMPAFKLAPRRWGVKGTREAKELDAAINNLVPKSETDGIKRFKIALQNLNAALGTTFSKTGKDAFTTYEDKGGEATSNLNQIVSGLMVKSALNGIIIDLEASAAGTSFEDLVARLAGGFTPNKEDKPIQDLVDADGNYISLKTIAGSTTIDGSIPNLAIGIANSRSTKPKVIYLVCVKDKETDPFKMRTFSFEITEDNYFQFITKKQNPTVEDVKKYQQKIFTALQVKEIEELLAEAKLETLAQADISNIFNKKAKASGLFQNVMNRYFEIINKKETATPEAFKDQVVQAIGKTQDLSPEEVEIFNFLLTRRASSTGLDIYEIPKDNFKDGLIDRIFKEGDVDVNPPAFVNFLLFTPKALEYLPTNREIEFFKKTNAGKKFEKTIQDYESYEAKKEKTVIDFKIDTIKNYLKKNRIEYPANLQSTGDSLKQISALVKPDDLDDLLKTAEKRAEGSLKGREEDYKSKGTEGEMILFKQELTKEINNMRSKLAPIINFINNFLQAATEIVGKEKSVGEYTRQAVEKAKGGEELTAQQIEDSKTAQKAFFASLKRFYNIQGESLTEGVAGGEQFDISQNSIKMFAEIDDSYPEVVIEKSRLFDSAKENAKLFEEWAEPLYRGMFYLTQGVNKYFLEDKPSGLKDAEDKGIKQVQSGITKIGGVAASQLGGPPNTTQQQTQQPAQVAESKKTSLNDDFLNDILKDLI